MTSRDDLGQRLVDFHLGAPVYSADGHPVGSLHRVVVDNQTWTAHQIIVKESARFSGHLLAPASALITDDLVVPIEAVDHVSHERVDLSLTSNEVRRLHPYLSYHYAPVSARDLSVEVVSAGFAGQPMPHVAEEATKAPGDIEIRQGENVMLGHEGEKLGRVKDVLVDQGELVGVVVRPEGFFQHDVVIQARFLERSDDAALFVRMTPEELKHLAEFSPR